MPGQAPSLADAEFPCFSGRAYGPRCPQRKKLVAAKSAVFFPPMASPAIDASSDPIMEVRSDNASTEIVSPDQERRREMARQESLPRAPSLNLTEMVAMCPEEAESGDEEAESDPSRPSVGEYRVKKELAALLESILLAHGDIASHCSSVPVPAWRSPFLELCCEVFRFLEESACVEDLEQKIAMVHSLGAMNIRVGWLEERVSDILEARRLVSRSPGLKEERDRTAEFIREAEARLNGYESEAAALDEKINRTKSSVAEAYSRAAKIVETHSDAKAKVRRFFKRSLVDGLLQKNV